MKQSFLAVLLLFTGYLSQAQMVGPDAYMKGLFVEVGINGDGGYEGVDTFVSAPLPGMHFRSNTQYFGFVANPQMDGWVNFDGDYYTPGSPENGWGIEIIDTTATDTFNIHLNNNRAIVGSGSDISGYITGYTYSGGITQVTWHGDYIDSTYGYDLDIDIEYTLGDSDLYYTTNVNILNSGIANIEHLYYFRNIDPDNNVVQTGGTYVTTNTIVNQASYCCPTASVKAEQSTPWSSTFAFYAYDTSARVSIGGFTNRDASDVWNATGGLWGTPGYVNTSDEAVSIAFYQPNLISFRAEEDSAAMFSFQTVFSASALNYLINGGQITTGVKNLLEEELTVYPNPTHDLLNVHSNQRIEKATVFNTLGVIVSNYNNVNSQSMQLDLSSLDHGTYILILEGSYGKITRKIVKY